MENWICFSPESIVYGYEVIGFHPSWIDNDYNPNGTRVGVFQKDQEDKVFFSSAQRIFGFECYIVDESLVPTHFINIPKNPISIENDIVKSNKINE